MTGSASILADAAESVLHVVAVAFAAFGFRLSQRPPTNRFHYGYEKIAFFSAGFEGAMIIVAAVLIIVEAGGKWLHGFELQRLGIGTIAVLGAGITNAALGGFLVHRGRASHSIILEANGKHVLTDSWTSFGVVVGLVLVQITGWKDFDPLFAILVALNILWSGGKLVKRSVAGLMDYADPAVEAELQAQFQQITSRLGIVYHGVRFRDTGGHVHAEAHLLFPFDMPVGEAHRLATLLEEELSGALQRPVQILTHLEAIEDHREVHRDRHKG
jgi:cation diffusion facilitator family transporter